MKTGHVIGVVKEPPILILALLGTLSLCLEVASSPKALFGRVWFVIPCEKIEHKYWCNERLDPAAHALNW